MELLSIHVRAFRLLIISLPISLVSGVHWYHHYWSREYLRCWCHRFSECSLVLVTRVASLEF
ncbi:hypothetical protein C2G38_2234888 [Gigaspora rosea]|uniref:Uncharacterized protein n=1 Tax=Gigaspora rosea TaxID=44941 RepID=A0A397TQU5_9GLOM|nr:hypothetical protein C2G38_2234888 [Gigaspora rosea]